MEMLEAKLYKKQEERKAKESGMYISKTTANEWGSRSARMCCIRTRW
jgi:hypothetical protein